MKAYKTQNARYFVSDGISNGTSWFTAKQFVGEKSIHRVVSPALPIRKTREEAQRDLDAWAKGKDFQVMDMTAQDMTAHVPPRNPMGGKRA